MGNVEVQRFLEFRVGGRGQGLAPNLVVRLGALPQALFGYRYAAQTLRDELKKVERTIIRVKESDWIDSLSEETSRATVLADPLAPVTSYTPANIPEAPYLYALFASTEFGENYKIYLELKRIERLLAFWQDQLREDLCASADQSALVA